MRAIVGAVALIFACCAVGEALASALHIAVPGAVIGMGLLLGGLALRGRAEPALDTAADGLVWLLPMLLVAPLAGIVDRWDVLAPVLGPLLLVLAISTFVALVVTGVTVLLVARRSGEPPA